MPFLLCGENRTKTENTLIGLVALSGVTVDDAEITDVYR